MESGNGYLPWFAIRVRNQCENSVATMLAGKGYEWFVPQYKSRRVWSDRIKEIQLPFFPGYVFCRFDLHRRLPIVTIPGVVNIVGTGKSPIPIDDAEIAGIQAAIRSGLASQPWPFLQIGQRVRISYGPLCELEGILTDIRGQSRLVLSVTLLQRSIAINVDAAWVTPISEKARVLDSPGKFSASLYRTHKHNRSSGTTANHTVAASELFIARDSSIYQAGNRGPT